MVLWKELLKNRTQKSCVHKYTHTQGYCVYMFTAFIDDDMQTGICIDINLWSTEINVYKPGDK